jgi:hypothetical protein
MTPTAQALAIVVAAAAVGLVAPSAASATVPAKYANCTAFHRYYPHGAGRVGARDHVATGGHPVTSWTRNTNAYNTAVHYNARLDADHDYVFCEKA